MKTLKEEDLEVIGTELLMNYINKNSFVVIRNSELLVYDSRVKVINSVYNIDKNIYYCCVLWNVDKNEYLLSLEKYNENSKEFERLEDLMTLYYDNRFMMFNNRVKEYYTNKEEFELKKKRFDKLLEERFNESTYQIGRKHKFNKRLNEICSKFVCDNVRPQTFIVKKVVQNKVYIEKGYFLSKPIRHSYVIEFVHFGRIKSMELRCDYV